LTAAEIAIKDRDEVIVKQADAIQLQAKAYDELMTKQSKWYNNKYLMLGLGILAGVLVAK
jgi:hypothetical protein